MNLNRALARVDTAETEVRVHRAQSLLLSRFMFPFSGMPRAAQWFAELLPLTHLLRLAGGVMPR